MLGHDHLVLFSSISHRIADRQLIEAADLTLYTHLQELVKRAYPNLDEEQWDTVYKNILACMKFKKNVRFIRPKYRIQGNSEVVRSAIKWLYNVCILDVLNFCKLFMLDKYTPLIVSEA